ncbi:hypothetical protein EON00_20210 [Burkholderia sp. ISTR5]|nr:hypothetical protein [Burkholderia sp. ISTR5]
MSEEESSRVDRCGQQAKLRMRFVSGAPDIARNPYVELCHETGPDLRRLRRCLNPARTRPESTLLLLKRLEADRFVWPNGGDTITLSAEQLHWLLDGIDLAVIQKHPQRYYARMS